MRVGTFINCSDTKNGETFMDRFVKMENGKFVGNSGHKWKYAVPIPYEEIKDMCYCEKGENGEAIFSPSLLINELCTTQAYINMGATKKEAETMAKHFKKQVNEIIAQRKD